MFCWLEEEACAGERKRVEEVERKVLVKRHQSSLFSFVLSFFFYLPREREAVAEVLRDLVDAFAIRGELLLLLLAGGFLFLELEGQRQGGVGIG